MQLRLQLHRPTQQQMVLAPLACAIARGWQQQWTMDIGGLPACSRWVHRVSYQGPLGGGLSACTRLLPAPASPPPSIISQSGLAGARRTLLWPVSVRTRHAQLLPRPLQLLPRSAPAPADPATLPHGARPGQRAPAHPGRPVAAAAGPHVRGAAPTAGTAGRTAWQVAPAVASPGPALRALHARPSPPRRLQARPCPQAPTLPGNHGRNPTRAALPLPDRLQPHRAGLGVGELAGPALTQCFLPCTLSFSTTQPARLPGSVCISVVGQASKPASAQTVLFRCRGLCAHCHVSARLVACPPARHRSWYWQPAGGRVP